MRGGFTILAVLIVIAAVSPEAIAGTMTVYSCHTPSGRAAGTTGWRVDALSAPTQLHTADDCASGARGSLIARIGGTGDAHGSEHLAWRFDAAPGTVVASFNASLCGRAMSWGSLVSVDWYETPLVWVYVSTFDQPKYLGCAGSPPWSASAANTVRADGLTSTRLRFDATCYLGGCPEVAGVVSDIEVSSFRADIRDDSAPVVTAVRGPLASNASHTGSETVAFDAADTGVGVFRSVVETRINREGPWREMAASVVSPLPGCTPLRETAFLYEFDSPQPCSSKLDGASITMDTALLPEGSHELRAVVEDAAGNRTDVIPPRIFFVAPRGTATPASAPLPAPTNGTGGSRLAQLRITAPGRPRVASSAAFRLAGRLLDMGSKPIAGAKLLVQARPFLPKAGRSEGDWATIGEVVTDEDGVFRGRIPAGASRSLLITYRAHPNDANPSANAQTDVVVPAQVTVRAARTRVRNRQSVVLKGRVAGPIPPGGVLVAMEVREPGRWIPVATTRRWVRTRPSGTFSLSYKFLRTFRPATYRFRVVADEDTAFQYGRGASRAVDIHVRP